MFGFLGKSVELPLASLRSFFKNPPIVFACVRIMNRDFYRLIPLVRPNLIRRKSSALLTHVSGKRIFAGKILSNRRTRASLTSLLKLSTWSSNRRSFSETPVKLGGSWPILACIVSMTRARLLFAGSAAASPSGFG